MDRRPPDSACANLPANLPTGPLVLARDAAHGPVVHDVGDAAIAQGIEPGSRIADLRALHPDLRVEPAAPARDAADIERLARWARRWCPWVEIDVADGAGAPVGEAALLLDTTGSAHLHGGEAAMLAEMARGFGALGLNPRIGLAPTVGAAWAMARHGTGTGIVGDGVDAIARALGPLPVAALRLDEPTALLLRRLGLKTVRALTDMPREALIRRFRRAEEPRANPVLRLDQAFGRQPEPLSAIPERPPMAAMHKPAEAIGDLAGLTHALGILTRDLCDALGRQHRGARGLRFTAWRVDGETFELAARTSRPARDAAHLAAMFDGKLDTIDPGFGIEAAALDAIDHEELGAEQDDLEGRREGAMAFSRLIDRLVSRLGPASVVRLSPRGSHLPERGEAKRGADRGAAASSAAAGQALSRAVSRDGNAPVKLFAHAEAAEVIHAVPDGPPARFRWRHQLHDVTRSAGPERIAPEWWRQKSTARLRDYYRVEDSEGRRFWLYREGVAGDDRGGAPTWFVHGLDA